MKTIPMSRKHQNLVHFGDYLYCSSHTDVYQAIFQRDSNQVKRSLKTTDSKLPKRMNRNVPAAESVNVAPITAKV